MLGPYLSETVHKFVVQPALVGLIHVPALSGQGPFHERVGVFSAEALSHAPGLTR